MDTVGRRAKHSRWGHSWVTDVSPLICPEDAHMCRSRERCAWRSALQRRTGSAGGRTARRCSKPWQGHKMEDGAAARSED